MAKTTVSYWNALDIEHSGKWEVVDDTGGLLEQLTLSIDDATGDYTRLTRFKPGADTKKLGAKSHAYPEEILVIKGRVFDAAFNRWLEAGVYASRPPGEAHGPFNTDCECIVLEISHPSQAVEE